METFVKLLYCLLLVLFISLTGCTPKPSIIDSYLNEANNGHKYEKILVIGATEKISYRTLFEAELVRQLKSQGVEAIPSYVLLPYNKKLTREIIQSAIEKYDLDSVMITSLVDSRKETQTVNLYERNFNDRNFYDYYNNWNYKGNSYDDFRKVKTIKDVTLILFLQTKFYDIRSEKLLWSLTSKSHYQPHMQNGLKPAIKLIVNKLSENGLI